MTIQEWTLRYELEAQLVKIYEMEELYSKAEKRMWTKVVCGKKSALDPDTLATLFLMPTWQLLWNIVSACSFFFDFALSVLLIFSYDLFGLFIYKEE